MFFLELTAPNGSKTVVNMDLVFEMTKATIPVDGIMTDVSRLLFNFQLYDDCGFTDVLEPRATIIDKCNSRKEES